MSDKPGSPPPMDAGSPTSGGKGKSKTPVPGGGGKKSSQSGAATPRGGSQSSRKGVLSPEPTVPSMKEETKEQPPSDEEYLKQLYQEQKEKERVQGLEKAHDTLLNTVAELHKQISNSDSKHIDALMHRKREKTEAAAHMKQLNQRIEQLEEENQQLQQQAKERETQREQAHTNAINLLEDRMAVIQAKYESLYQFKEEKADLELQLAKYKELLAQEKENHALNVSELERRNVMEKDRLKNEMLRKIRETKLSLLAMTEDQLHTTTKRTIMENEQMTTELQYQSKETERIVKRNQKLSTENANLKRELELSASTQQQMAKRTMFFQSLITKLQGKLDTLQLEKEKEKQQFTHSIQQLQSQVQYLQGGGGMAPTNNKFGSSGAFNDRGQSSLGGILRGVEEMNALASAAGGGGGMTPGGGQGLPLLPQARSGSSQSRHTNKGADSRASYYAPNIGSGMMSPNSVVGSSSQEDAATIARLNDKLQSVEREKSTAILEAKQSLAGLREEKLAKGLALETVQRLEQEVADLQSLLARKSAASVATRQLSEQAVSFLTSCLEDQRMTYTALYEKKEKEKQELDQATLHSVVAEGTESTVVVRAAGEKAVQGTTALLLEHQSQHQSAHQQQGRSSRAPSPALSISSSTGPGATPSAAGGTSTAVGGWNPSHGYPSSLASFTTQERQAILEHLLQQIVNFQRTNPKDMGLGSPIPGQSVMTPRVNDTDRSESPSSVSVTNESHPPPHPSTGAHSRTNGSFSSSVSQRASPALTNHSHRSGANSRAE